MQKEHESERADERLVKLRLLIKISLFISAKIATGARSLGEGIFVEASCCYYLVRQQEHAKKEGRKEGREFEEEKRANRTDGALTK